jgi:uncharacterized membrane protein HdeD (DUF308 family)
VSEPHVRVAGSEVVLIADPKKLWPLMALRGALTLLFGIIALLWPGITVLALALLFGAFALVDGVTFLISAFRQRRDGESWRGWLPSLVGGLLAIAAAVITVLAPGITALALAVLAGLLLIFVGVVEVVLAIRLRTVIRGEVFLALAGVLAVLAGLAILFWPDRGILALTLLLGGYSVVGGLLLIVAALRVRAVAKTRDRR